MAPQNVVYHKLAPWGAISPTLKTTALVRSWKQHQIVCKKQTADLAAYQQSNSDTLVDSDITTYPIHIKREGDQSQYMLLSEFKPTTNVFVLTLLERKNLYNRNIMN